MVLGVVEEKKHQQHYVVKLLKLLKAVLLKYLEMENKLDLFYISMKQLIIFMKMSFSINY